MEERARIMKIASLKFSTEEPSFYNVQIDEDGNVYYYNEKGHLHRLDGPAIEYANGSKEWIIESKHHRLDGPAVEWRNGYKEWYYKGKRHRLDGPAIEWPDGDKWWYVNNELIGKSREGFTQRKFEQWKRKHGL
jgi:hypothetical protein